MAALSAAPRARLLLRVCCTLESSSLLASRGFGTSADTSDAAPPMGQPPPDAWAEAGSAATAATLDAASAPGTSPHVAAAAAAASGAEEYGAVLGAAVAAVDGLHAATGLPWWATIAAVGAGVRVAMLPLSLQSMKAGAALTPLLRQARQDVEASLAATASAAAGAATSQHDVEQRRQRGGRDLAAKQQRWQRAQQQAATAAATHHRQQQGGDAAAEAAAGAAPRRPPGPSVAQVLVRFHQLRQLSGAPHPAWLLAAPLAQLPVFVTAMAAVRAMSLGGWPGFSEGGTAWFTDLTLPAMDLSTWTAPMGTAGVVLPAGVVLCMLANIDAAFSAPAGSRGQAGVLAWALGGLRLLLEWLMVPLFGVALQLPQGALCYWASSSALALLQNAALRRPAVRAALGLPAAPQQAGPQAGQQQQQPAAAGAAASPPAGVPAGVDPALRSFLLATSDQATLFARAAELRAEGRAAAAAAVLQHLLDLHPGQPNALMALGQLRAALGDWGMSEQLLLQAAASEQLDAQSRARCWFGAGAALHMQREHDTALECFARAAEAAQSDALRVRAWVAQATLRRSLGQLEEAAALLRKAARAEPGVERTYLLPLLAEMEGRAQKDGGAERRQQQQQQAPAVEEGGMETPRLDVEPSAAAPTDQATHDGKA